MEWDWCIEIDSDPNNNPVRWTDKGVSYVQISSRLDQDMVEYLIDMKSPEKPLSGPLEMNLFFYLARGNRRSKHPHNHESLDQLSRFVEKCCAGKLFKNKKQICKRLEVKEFADDVAPRVIILIRKINARKKLP